MARTTTFTLEQALFVRSDGSIAGLMARSAGFSDDWITEAEQLMTDFGERPAGVACPLAVFAFPFGKKQVAVVQVADQAGTPALGFHFLILPVKYWRMQGDPFALAERHPAPWEARTELSRLEVPAEPSPMRTVADVQQVLKRVRAFALKEDEEVSVDSQAATTTQNAEGPALLGGAQVLVDGGKLMIERPQPDPEFLRSLWTLLPNSNRAELWPASFAFSAALGFDAVVVPRVQGQPSPGYTSEEQAADYPQSHYELSLQTAAEAGDQDELNRLFARRSVSQVWRLGLGLVITMGLLAWFMNSGKLPNDPEIQTRNQKAGVAAGMVGVGDPYGVLGYWRAGKVLWGPKQAE